MLKKKLQAIAPNIPIVETIHRPQDLMDLQTQIVLPLSFLNRKKVVIKPSGGKEAKTFFRVKKRFRNATWVEVFPKTGRTHQIRVHMAYMGHPIIGDILYGASSPWINRQALHAFSLTLNHPSTGERFRFESPLPDDIQILTQHLASSTGEP